jgi:hypothetical protein
MAGEEADAVVGLWEAALAQDKDPLAAASQVKVCGWGLSCV